MYLFMYKYVYVVYIFISLTDRCTFQTHRSHVQSSLGPDSPLKKGKLSDFCFDSLLPAAGPVKNYKLQKRSNTSLFLWSILDGAAREM